MVLRENIDAFVYKNRGFTIIELLVVTSIIALLASIVMANLHKSVEKARVATGNNFEAQIHHLLGNNAIVSWNFDETGGGTQLALDSSGNNRSGTFAGGVARDSSTKTGKGYSILYSASSNAYVESPVLTPAGSFTPGVTLSAWVRLSSGTQDHGIIGLYSGSTAVLSFSIDYGTGNRLKTEWYTTDLYYSLPAIELNDWVHVAYSFKDGSPKKCQMYVNGRPVAFDPAGGGGTVCDDVSPGTFNRVYAGLIEDENTRIGTRVDDIRVYSETLIASAIHDIYLAGLADHKSIAQK